MKCRYCGTELPSSAKFCDHCGKPVTKREKLTIDDGKSATIRRAIIAFLILCAIIFLLISGIVHVAHNIRYNYTDDPVGQSRALQRLSIGVTSEMVSSIDCGMAYDDVIDIIGEEGVITYMDEASMELTWLGEYSGKLGELPSTLRVVFDSETDEVIWVEEKNIIDGAEIYDNMKNYKESRTELTEKEIDAIPDMASYDVVCETMGGPGVLYSSTRDTERTYQYYCWRYLDGDAYRDAKLLFVNGRYQRY